MKKCPTCDKTYEDSMRFCQLDGATLVDDEPAFDPYATIVSTPAKPIILDPEPAAEPEPAIEVASPVEEAASEPEVHQTVGSIAIAPPDEILDLPEVDPLKTMYASDTEMSEILAAQATMGEEPAVDETPVVEEAPAAVETAAVEPEPPSFIAPEVPAPSFGDMSPPPSPFSTPEPAVEEIPAPQPIVEEPAPEPVYDEPATIIQSTPSIPFEPPAPVQEWTPPPAPDASWQNQEIGSNTPFQPPPAGAGGQNQTLAIVSLVLGIISLCCYISPVTGLAALITGFMATKKANNDPANFGGKGLALAGMITGGIFFLIGVAYWIYIIVVIGFVGLSSLSR